MLTLGSAIRQLRGAAGLTQKELAERLGISPTYVSHLEAGRKEPSVQLLRDLAKSLDVPFGFLLAIVLWVDLPPAERAAYQPLMEGLLNVAAAA